MSMVLTTILPGKQVELAKKDNIENIISRVLPGMSLGKDAPTTSPRAPGATKSPAKVAFSL